jgi:hypothetical protein
MKSCFVVNYWADTDEKVEMIVECIKQLKKTDRDIIYTSLCPIDKRISSETNFSVFSNTNELITLFNLLDNKLKLINTMNYDSPGFRFFSRSLNWKGVSYSVCNQLLTSFKMLKSLGYTDCHFLVGDCIIADSELNVFTTIEKACSLLNKRAYFDDISERFGEAYSGIYFYSNVDFFISNFTTSQTKDDHLKQYTSGHGILCFEQILKYHFKNKEKFLLLGNNDSEDFGPLLPFKESNIDIVQSYNSSTSYHIIPLEITHGVIEADYVFVLSKEIELTNFKIYIDDKFQEGMVGCDGYLYTKTNKKQFNLKVLKNDVVDFEEMITEERLNRINSYAFFDPNKRNI